MTKISSLTAIFMFVIAALIPTAAFAQKGEKTVGLRAGYSTRNESAIAGVYFQYRFSRYFRLAPNLV